MGTPRWWLIELVEMTKNMEMGAEVPALDQFTDEDFRLTVLRATRLIAILTLVGIPIVWWKLGWQSVALLVLGAAISGSGIWEWRRLMSAVMAQMDAETTPGKKPRMAMILIGFFLRMGVVIALLYVSLKYLDGSVYALAAGLLMGVVSLTVEGIRLVRLWTV